MRLCTMYVQGMRYPSLLIWRWVAMRLRTMYVQGMRYPSPVLTLGRDVLRIMRLGYALS